MVTVCDAKLRKIKRFANILENIFPMYANLNLKLTLEAENQS